MVLSFVVEHADTIIAILALIGALQANVLSRRAKADSDRILLSEKKRDLLQEIDRQHVTLLRVKFVVQDELQQFDICPDLSRPLPGELERLRSNLGTLDNLERFCLDARAKAEQIDVRHDPAQIDIQYAEVGRLTAHLQKDLEHEKSLLESKKNLVRTVPEEFREK